MAINRKSQQVLSYLTRDERERVDARVAEAEVSRAEWIRQAVNEKLDRDDRADAFIEASGEVIVVDDNDRADLASASFRRFSTT